MKNTIVRTAAIATLSLFALAGCGSTTAEEPVQAPTIEQETEEAAPEPSDAGEAVSAPGFDAEAEEPEDTISDEGGQGIYQGETYEGAIVTVAVPGEAPEDVVSYQEAAGAQDVGYLVAEVDNTGGTSETYLFEIQVVDTEGKTHTYQDLSSATYAWGSPSDLVDRELELWEKYPYNTAVMAKNTIPLAGPTVPEDVAAVIIDGVRIERVGDL